MAHAWKACWVQALGGSNPPSSAEAKDSFIGDLQGVDSVSAVLAQRKGVADFSSWLEGLT